MPNEDEISGGGDFLEAEKEEAMEKYNRSMRAKKYIGYVAVSATTVALSCVILWFPVLVETVKPPLRLLCLVVIPQLRVLCGNPRFLFIVSNVIIITLAAQSGMISSTPSTHGVDIYAEFIRRSESMPKYSMIDSNALCKDMGEFQNARPPRDPRARRSRRSDSAVTATSAKNQENSKLPLSPCPSSSSLIVVGNEAAMSDDELNKRAEEFIANFNRQLRLQRERSVSPAGR
uniref:DUF4408 domain-containing protein n=1 Tax=Araucaria cunninghamii TaxID=56994 RepID=A0A0D6QVL2_ARACU